MGLCECSWLCVVRSAEPGQHSVWVISCLILCVGEYGHGTFLDPSLGTSKPMLGFESCKLKGEGDIRKNPGSSIDNRVVLLLYYLW